MSLSLESWPVQQGLRIGFLNIRNATNKTDEIASILYNSKNNFHLFGFAESRLSFRTSDSDMSIPGYNIFRLDPKKHRDTGIIVYFSSSLNCTRLFCFDKYDVESIWVEIKLKGTKPLLVGYIYRNPAENVNWRDKFSSLMDDISMKDYETIILGDFNIDILKPHHIWHNTFSMYRLKQLIDIPTRISENSRSLIDHIYTNNKDHIIETCAPPCGCSDHNAVCLTWHNKKVKIPKIGHKTIYYRSFKHFKTDEFLIDLANSQLEHIYQFRDPDEATQFWINTFSDTYNRHAPFIKKRVRHETKPPWIDKEIDEEIKKRNHLKKYGTTGEFKKQRNKVNSLKRKSKRSFLQNILVNSKDSRTTWKAINILTNRCSSRNQQIIRDISPDMLNNHFATIAERTVSIDRSKENMFYHLKDFIDNKSIYSQFNLQHLSVFEVSKIISSLKHSRSRDLDGLDAKILDLAGPVITDSLTYLYNLCIDKAYIPLKFKQAKVIPLFKSGDPSNPSNYRPISILSTIAKPLEKHLQKCLYTYVVENDLLHVDQSGFRKNHSCHTALIQLTDCLLNSINENKFSGLLSIDFQKAFDVIKHPVLIQKLEIMKLPPTFIGLMSSFLTDRKQLVIIDSQMSEFQPVNFGVPQGSVLGPLLFSIYVNDLPFFVEDNCEMFADDTSICSSDSDPNTLTDKLQTNLEKVINWTELNHMSLNSEKTKCMYVSARQKRQKMDTKFKPLQIGTNVVEEVNSVKTLGVIIDRDLSWKEHTSFLVKRISTKLFQLSRIKHFLDLHSRKLFFFGHILPIVDYASTVWDSCSENNFNTIHRMYKRALKLVLLKSSSLTSEDYKKLNVLSLRNRLFFNKAIHMHNVTYGNAPKKISRKFVINHHRHTHLISLPKPRSNLFKASFMYSGGSLWNNLSKEFTSIRNKNTFKKKLKAHLIGKQ